MKRLLRRRPSPALVIACLALFVALGPAAYATHLVVNSSDVVDGSLTGVDIANGSLQNPDIALNAINGTKVASNSLSGADINESSLGIVPNANLLDGLDSGAFVQGTAARIWPHVRRTVADGQSVVAMTFSFFRLEARCLRDAGEQLAAFFWVGTDSGNNLDIATDSRYVSTTSTNVTDFASGGGRATVQVGQTYRVTEAGFPRTRMVTLYLSGKGGSPCHFQAQALAQG